MRQTYVIKCTLNAWIEHHTFNLCFFHTLYMRLTHRLTNLHFTTVEKPYAYILQPMHENSFSRNLRLTHILVNVCFTKHPFNVRYLTYVKRALMNVR